MTTAIKSCAQCRTVLLPGQSRCLVCGADSAELTRPCPRCGHATPLTARFCTQCGQALREPAAAGPEPVAESVTEAEFVKVRNPGARFYAGIGGTVMVLLALVSIHSFVAATFFTPQRAVAGYFDALAARDAPAALSYLEPIQVDGVLLTDAVLRHEGYRPPENIAVGDVPAEGDRRVVPVGFELDGRSYRIEVIARRAGTRTLGVFRGWVVEGGLLPLAVRPERIRPVVNGVAVPDNLIGPLAVFPGQYRVGIADNPLFQAKEATATVAGQGGGARLAPALKDSARSEIESQVKSYLDGCARSTDLRPPGCPFAVPAGTTGTGVKWTITAYPQLAFTLNPETGEVSVRTGRDGRADATGTSSDGTAFARSVGFRVTGTAALAGGKVSFTAR
ncbi:MAG TPA: zinc ribbon domain-containing protein [Candidatus Limnocylindrales bacterium]|nr:zinc ribbon domain-containing protein [Candidatus Limnocylindrales bacterium]